MDNNHGTNIMKNISLNIHLSLASIPLLFTEQDTILKKISWKTIRVLSLGFMNNQRMKIDMIYTVQCLSHYLSMLLKIYNLNTTFISKINISYGKTIYILILHISQSILSISSCRYNTSFYFGKL